MADYTVTLHISPENRAFIDKLRGDTDTAEFVENMVMDSLVAKAIEARLLTTVPGGIDIGDDDLTPEMLTRLADEGEADAMDFDEFERTLRQRIQERRAKRNRVEAAQ